MSKKANRKSTRFSQRENAAHSYNIEFTREQKCCGVTQRQALLREVIFKFLDLILHG
jgi:hypothetical protein